MKLKEKVAIVTGASSGIGREAALLFAREGARIVVAARRAHLLNSLLVELRTLGAQAIAVAGDVRDEKFAASLVGAAVDEWGGLDVAFNNAGSLAGMGPTTEVSAADWAMSIDANLTSAFFPPSTSYPPCSSETALR